ncbi:glycosyltransferase [archaeon]|jgi:ADP-heptose:LPS heptosyltransferase|nr:glycosyltransferase [archaeon]
MNILVIKTGALGDVVRTSFIAQALKEKYFDTKKRIFPKLYWITQKNALPFFKNNPYIDKALPQEKKHLLKNTNFNLVINLEEDKENCNFAKNLNPQELIGFTIKNKKIQPTKTTKEWFNMSALGEKLQNDILKKQNKKTHRQIISEIIKIKHKEKYEPFLRLTQEQRIFANQFLRRYNLKRTDLIIGINTGSADRWPKQLSIKKTAKLIDNLYNKYKAKILLFGGPNEQDRNQKIQRLSNSPIIDTGCGNNLTEFPALVSVCNLLITSDSLGLHISLALKRKTIVLLGPTSNTEIDMYGLGEKVISDSKCTACYKPNCKSMEKISLNKILQKTETLLKQKISLLITAFKEPNIDQALKASINQKTKYPYEIILSAPDKETLEKAKKYSKIKTIKDKGKGKSLALNQAFQELNTDILILTDGDTQLGEDTVQEITTLFQDPEIGCVSGKPVPQESRKTKYGYWANFLFNAAHRIRKKAHQNNSFIECSGYLFAFRKKKIRKIPIDVAEDTIIPYILYQKGYKIAYAENAEVFVKNADNWKDWIKQKTRTHKSHTNIGDYVDTKTTPKIKTFKNEIKGIKWLITYPRNTKEIIWTIQLALARFYSWIKYYLDIIFFHKHYYDGWERIESTK